MTLSVDDIFAGAMLRTRNVTLEHGGDITIHELPADECWEMAELAQDGKVSPNDHARFCLRVLGVSADSITDEMADKLLRSIGANSVSELCVYGYDFNNDGEKKA